MNLLLSDPAFLSVVSGGGGYDPDAQAYITAVETADGQTLETAVKDAINDFVLGCKADGIWPAIKASCILAGARTIDGALVPLVGTAPTNYNFVAGDYNRKLGLKKTTGTKYLDSNRNNSPTSGGDPQDSRHLALYRTESESRGGAQALVGIGGGSTGDSMLLTTSTTRFYRLAMAGGASQPDTSQVSGLYAASRFSNTQVVGRYAGVSNTYTDASGTPSIGNIYVFGRNVGGALSTPTDARLAFYSIGESLDLALLDARVTTLINAFSTAIP